MSTTAQSLVLTLAVGPTIGLWVGLMVGRMLVRWMLLRWMENEVDG